MHCSMESFHSQLQGSHSCSSWVSNAAPVSLPLMIQPQKGHACIRTLHSPNPFCILMKVKVFTDVVRFFQWSQAEYWFQSSSDHQVKSARWISLSLHDLLAFPSGLLRCTSQQHTHVFPLATLVVTCSILKKHITTLKLTYLTVKRMFHQSNRALVRFFRADDALEIFKLHYFMSW